MDLTRSTIPCGGELEEQVDAVGGGGAAADDRGVVGGCRKADWLTLADSRMDSRAADILSRGLVCCMMRGLVARWCAAVSKARERAVVPALLGELTMTKKTRRELRARAMALARLIGCVQLVVKRLRMFRFAVSNWGMAVLRCRSVRAEALVAVVVPAEDWRSRCAGGCG